MTWTLIQTLFHTWHIISYLVQTDVKGMVKAGFLLMVLSMLMKQQLLLKNVPALLFKTKVQSPYPAWKQNGLNRYLSLTKTAKTLPVGVLHTYIAHIREYTPRDLPWRKKQDAAMFYCPYKTDLLENNEFFLLQTLICFTENSSNCINKFL